MINQPLWKHQQSALDFLLQRFHSGINHAALFMEMRTGKTQTAVEFIKETKAKRVLILIPKKTNLVWKHHCEQFQNNLTINDLTDGRLVERAGLIKKIKEGIILLNYDALSSRAIQDAINPVTWDIVIADEAHRLKSPSSLRSKVSARLKAQFKLALTGTPYHNSPLDVFGIARFLNPVFYKGGIGSALFGSWTSFKFHYATWYGPQNYILGDYINQDELATKIDAFAFQVKSKDVLDLPEQQHITYPVQLESGVLTSYKKLEKENVVRMDQGTISSDNALVNILRLQQMLGGYAVFDGGERTPISIAKAEALCEILEEIGNQPIVVFYRFNTDLEMITKQLKYNGILEWYELNGKKNELSEWFLGNNILLVQISAGAEGIDLSKAQYCIYYSKDFSLGTYQQSLARFLKSGEKNQVNYIHLIIPNSIDSDINDSLTSKESNVKQLESRIRNRYAL